MCTFMCTFVLFDDIYNKHNNIIKKQNKMENFEITSEVIQKTKAQLTGITNPEEIKKIIKKAVFTSNLSMEAYINGGAEEKIEIKEESQRRFDALSTALALATAPQNIVINVDRSHSKYVNDAITDAQYAYMVKLGVVIEGGEKYKCAITKKQASYAIDQLVKKNKVTIKIN